MRRKELWMCYWILSRRGDEVNSRGLKVERNDVANLRQFAQDAKFQRSHDERQEGFVQERNKTIAVHE